MSEYINTVRPIAAHLLGDNVAMAYYPISSGLWVTRKEWELFRNSIDNWFNTNPDREIDNNNRTVNEHLEYHLSGERINNNCKLCIEHQTVVNHPNEDDSGYVYLIKSEHGYKIGKSKNPERRKTEIKLPFKSAMIHSFRCANYTDTEKKLHNKFSEKRIDGEWFDLSGDDVTYILSLSDEVTQ